MQNSHVRINFHYFCLLTKLHCTLGISLPTLWCRSTNISGRVKTSPSCSFYQRALLLDLDLVTPSYILWAQTWHFTFLNLARVYNVFKTFFSAYITNSGFFPSTMQKCNKVSALSFWRLSPFLLLNTFLIYSTIILTSLLIESLSNLYDLLLIGLYVSNHFVLWFHEDLLIRLLITTCINKRCDVSRFLLINHVKLNV